MDGCPHRRASPRRAPPSIARCPSHPTWQKCSSRWPCTSLYFERSWRLAESHFRRAVELNPRRSWAHAYLGLYLVTTYRFDEVEAHLRTAVELDPLSSFIHALSGLAQTYSWRLTEALASGHRALELQPDYLLGLWTYGLAQEAAGHLAEAERLLTRAVDQSRMPMFLAILGKVQAQLGKRAECDRIELELDERQTRGEYILPMAAVGLALGRKDLQALRRALRACASSDINIFTLRLSSGTLLDTFRTDAEVQSLLTQIYDGAGPAAASS